MARKNWGAYSPDTMTPGMPPGEAGALVNALGMQFDVDPEAMKDAAFYGMNAADLMGMLADVKRNNTQRYAADAAETGAITGSFNHAIGTEDAAKMHAYGQVLGESLRERSRGDTAGQELDAKKMKAILDYLASQERSKAIVEASGIKADAAGNKPLSKDLEMRVNMLLKNGKKAEAKALVEAAERTRLEGRAAAKLPYSEGEGSGVTGGPGGALGGDIPEVGMLNSTYTPERIITLRMPDISIGKPVGQKASSVYSEEGSGDTAPVKDWSFRNGEAKQDVHPFTTPKRYRDPYNQETQAALSAQFKDLAKRDYDDPIMSAIDAQETNIDFRKPGAWKEANALNQRRNKRASEMQTLPIESYLADVRYPDRKKPGTTSAAESFAPPRQVSAPLDDPNPFQTPESAPTETKTEPFDVAKYTLNTKAIPDYIEQALKSKGIDINLPRGSFTGAAALGPTALSAYEAWNQPLDPRLLALQVLGLKGMKPGRLTKYAPKLLQLPSGQKQLPAGLGRHETVDLSEAGKVIPKQLAAGNSAYESPRLQLKYGETPPPPPTWEELHSANVPSTEVTPEVLQDVLGRMMKNYDWIRPLASDPIQPRTKYAPMTIQQILRQAGLIR